MGRLFQMLIQPGLVKPEMLDESSIPSVDEMKVAALRLDQIGIRKLKDACNLATSTTFGRLNIFRLMLCR
jgi:hypothetical protein